MAALLRESTVHFLFIKTRRIGRLLDEAGDAPLALWELKSVSLYGDFLNTFLQK
jgi:hypothetical protein